MPFATFVVLLCAPIFLIVYSRTIGIASLHLLSLLWFQGLGLLAVISGYSRPDVVFDDETLQQLSCILLVYAFVFVISYVISSKNARKAHKLRPNVYINNIQSEKHPKFLLGLRLLQILFIAESIFYCFFLLVSRTTGSRVELPQVGKIIYYISLFIFMYLIANGIPFGKRAYCFLLFILPKLFIGFFGWRGGFLWVGVPYIFLSWGEEWFLFFRKSLIGIFVRFIFPIKSLYIIGFIILGALLWLLPLGIRSSSNLLDAFIVAYDLLSSSFIYIIAELAGSPFFLGFYNNISEVAATNIYWPFSTVFDIYLQPFFTINPLFAASPFNLPLRYDRFMSNALISPDALAGGAGTGGSLSGEMLASGGVLSAIVFAILFGIISRRIDLRAYHPTFSIDICDKPSVRFLSYWLCTKLFLLPRGTIAEIFDMLPILMIVYYLVLGPLFKALSRNSANHSFG